MATIVPMLVVAGALDYVDVSAGTDGDLVSNMLHEPPMGLEPAPYASTARLIKEAIDVPVIHGTRIHTPELAEALIARGDADMAGMCRSLIADPLLPVKARTARRGEIIPCVGCEQACFGRLYRGLAISCVGNPVTGREREYRELGATDAALRVLVVGGGPAGLEAARVAAARGHAVILAEAKDRLGGRLDLARRPRGREEWGRLIASKVDAVTRAGVEVRLRTAIDAAALAGLAPNAVILATGAHFPPLDLPGAGEAPIVGLDDAAAAPELVGHKVLIIDYLDRQPAMVMAMSLADAGHDVELATASFHVGMKLEIQNITYAYRRALAAGVTFTPVSRPAGFEGATVVMENPFTGQKRTSGPYDTIITVTPGLPRDELAEGVRALGIPVRIIGDAYAPRDVEAAILEGLQAGNAL
jgi:NADPH-dependent 2,4-dienoyl-CoA reductase/sulfur reductase-like enzyme